MPDRLPVARRHSPLETYGLALALVGLAFVTTWLITPLEQGPLALFLCAVAIAAAFGGLGPGLFATLLSVLAVVATMANGDLAFAREKSVRIAAFVAAASVVCALTERSLRASHRERARREWSEVTLSSIGDAVIVTDAEARVLSINRAAQALTGYSSADALGRPLSAVFRIVAERTHERMEDPIARIRREGGVVGISDHAVLITRDGTEIPIDDSGAPIWSDDGRLVGAVLVFRDMSRQRAVDRQLKGLLDREQAARLKAESANRAKDEFLATLSHELRTPLNAMLGWTQILQERSTEDADLQHGLEVITRNVRRLTRLIDDVLDVSRIVSGKLHLDLQPVGIAPVIESALEVVRPDAEKQHIRIELEVEGDLNVLGDPDRLQQVLCNLLSNAIKFSPKGTGIRISAAARGDAVEIVVRDRGIGISPEFLPFLFDRFRQEDSSSHRAHGGLGLGLAIVRHLVLLHGGQIEAQSPGTGRGATFIVKLPLQQDRMLDALGPGKVGTEIEPIPLTGLRIVAVDDDPDARDLLERMLRRAGAEVRITARADEARVLVHSWRPHVLLSDLEMPGQDGFALVRRLRADGFAALPAIAVTAYAGAEHRVRAIDAGFQAHISKPLDQRQLERVIAAAARWRPEA